MPPTLATLNAPPRLPGFPGPALRPSLIGGLPRGCGSMPLPTPLFPLAPLLPFCFPFPTWPPAWGPLPLPPPPPPWAWPACFWPRPTAPPPFWPWPPFLPPLLPTQPPGPPLPPPFLPPLP